MAERHDQLAHVAAQRRPAGRFAVATSEACVPAPVKDAAPAVLVDIDGAVDSGEREVCPPAVKGEAHLPKTPVRPRPDALAGREREGKG